MRPRRKMPLLLLIGCLAIPSDAFFLPLLFPISIKITFHSNHKPTPPPKPSYHFEEVPVYREVVVKGSAHISPPKVSYGGGQKYGSSYGDGHIKVYTEEPHIKGTKYGNGYGSSSGTGGYIDGHFSISSQPASPPTHYKGNPYDSHSGQHYQDVPYSQTDYKGQTDKGIVYVQDGDVPPTHYKGTPYHDNGPPTHYKGTTYEEDAPTHYKGSSYDEGNGHYNKGSGPSSYDDGHGHYKGSGPSQKRPIYYDTHSYIKPVGGGYKFSDYISDDKNSKYPEEDDSYIAVPPGRTYAEIQAEHKAKHSPKAYAADQYSDLGGKKYTKDYEHDASYIDDTLPAYKSNIPRPRYRYQASASRYDRVLPPAATEHTKLYAGFGTSIYGDSYARITYVPKSLRISIRAYAHK